MTKKETEQEGYFTVATYTSSGTGKNTLGISEEREEEITAHILKIVATSSKKESITLASAHARSLAELWYISTLWAALQDYLSPSDSPVHIDPNELPSS